MSGARSAATTSGPGIALSYDDGPHPEFTPRILDVLRDADVRATFFVVGERAQQYPEIVRRIVAEGHSIGAHSMTHVDLRTLPRRQMRHEVQASVAAVSAVAGVNVDLFRPPFGGLNLRTAIELRRQRLRVSAWGLDTHDWRPGATIESITERARGAAPGTVLLLHDTSDLTVAATKAILSLPHRDATP